MNLSSKMTSETEFGMSIEQKRAFFQNSKQLITKEDKNHVYLQPILKCTIKSRGFTESNMFFTLYLLILFLK